MAKHYTPEAPTPVFAVTFVSNRKGIVPEPVIDNKVTTVDNSAQIKIIEDKIKKEDEFINDGFTFSDRAVEYRDKARVTRANLQLELEALKGNNKSTSSKTKDVEYLVYSNVEIEPTSDTDLSKQSNWFLRDAEVEVTRDWPICKAKLIIACKLEDDGTIPPLKDVENGFYYSATPNLEDKTGRDVKLKLLPTGRLLGVDDEVRIYAGYKSNTCVSMNDLDQYPFSFSNLETKELPDNVRQALSQLDKQKKDIEEAISKMNNFLYDPNFYLTVAVAAVTMAAVVTFITATAPVTIPASTVILPGVAAGATATSTLVPTTIAATGTTVAPGVFVAGAAGVTAPTTVFIASGTTIGYISGTLTAGSAIGTGGALASTLASSTTAATTTVAAGTAQGAAAITGAAATGTAIGNARYAVDSNEALKKALATEIEAINNLIRIIQKQNGIEEKAYTATKDLAPIFWGFIDSVDFVGNSNGVQIIYSLRDRSRILADTKIVTVPFLTADKGERGAFEGLRHKTIEGVYRASNGGIYLDNSYTNASSSQWRQDFKAGSIITLWDNAYKDSTNPGKGRVVDQVKEIQNNTSVLSEEKIKFDAAIENQAKWVIANSFLPNPESPYDPLFHIWTLQPPLGSGSGPSSIQIINKSPFEILSHLSTTEVMPIDFFASHVNGHFMFAPRVLDTTGLEDPERGNRLYFFFDCFDNIPPSRSVIKDIRVTTSTIGIYNRFAVASADFNNPTNASLRDIVSVVDVASANTKNKKIPIKQHIIIDPKIKNASKELVGTSTAAAAQALALTTASISARDNITVQMKVIGDSSFFPGEAIRVYNTILHSNGILTFKSTPASQSLFLKTLYEEVEKIKKSAIQQTGDKKKIVTLDTALTKIRQASGEETSQLNNVLPMYKVRAITHSLKASGNDAGYTTKIYAIGDIL